jgi:hypothetical protein
VTAGGCAPINTGLQAGVKIRTSLGLATLKCQYGYESTFLRIANTPSTIGFVRSLSSHRFIAACVLVSFCLITGCGSNARNIVGSWRSSTDPNAMVWEFSNDGSILMGPNRGRYTFGDNNRIKIQTSIATSVYQIELVGDKMTLKEPNGSKLVLTRVK